jgi:DNA-binding NtrC family response regulator
MSRFGFSTAMLDPTDLQGRRPACYSLDTFPVLGPQDGAKVNIPNALVVGADGEICAILGEALLLCGIAPTLAASISASRQHLATGKFSMVLCQDHLPDGRYSDLLRLNQQTGKSVPVIVVSRTGDWQDYFTAVDLGAQDFLAYPLIPGELQRILRGFLAERGREEGAQSASLI